MVKRHLHGYRPDGKDARDFSPVPLFKMVIPPTHADLSTWRPDIEDQGPEGSCVTFGIGGAVRTVVRRDAPQFDFVWNHQQFYNGARQLAGTFDQDSGLELRSAMKYLRDVGVGHDDLWPYDPANLFVPPPQEVLDDAFQYKVLKYHPISNSMEMRLAIASGFPVIFGIALYESWENVGPNGILPMPAQGEQILGYHCMRGDGYQDGVINVVNQYSTSWGHGGVCFARYEYFDSPSRMIFALAVDVFGSEAEQAAGTAVGQRPPK